MYKVPLQRRERKFRSGRTLIYDYKYNISKKEKNKFKDRESEEER